MQGIPRVVFSSLLREGGVGNRNISLKQLLTNPLSFSKFLLKLLILNTMVQQSSEDLSSSVSHVAGLGQTCTILGDGVKRHFGKTKCL